jgi:hypothetical protein
VAACLAPASAGYHIRMWRQDGVTITRDQLYEEVWAEPMVKVAPRYGVSDVALKKTCRRMDVPVPPRGYWAKLEAGKRVTKLALPKAKPTTKTSATIRGAPKPYAAEYRELDPATLAAERKATKPAIVVKNRASRHHPLVAATIGAKQSKGVAPHKGYPGPAPLDVRVTTKSFGRAMRIMDALVTALEAEGCRIHTGWGHKGETAVELFGESIPIELREKTRRVAHQPTRAELDQKKLYGWASWREYDYEHTGELQIRLDTWMDNLRRTWNDTATQRIEDQLDSVVVGIIALADAHRARTRLHAEEARVREEEERRHAEEEARRLEEKRLREQLLSWANGELRRLTLVGLIDRVERAAIGEPCISQERLAAWLAWARSEAMAQDPITTILESLRLHGLD